jgi:hypothetical protein
MEEEEGKGQKAKSKKQMAIGKRQEEKSSD